MDWVDGVDLGRVLQTRGRPGLSPSSVVAWLAEAADALTHLHTRDPPVIHGDVKPANLVLTRGGHIVLVDFGVSTASGSRTNGLGTPGFTAPELAHGTSEPRVRRVRARRHGVHAAHRDAPDERPVDVGRHRPRADSRARDRDPRRAGDRPGAPSGDTRGIRRALARRMGLDPSDRCAHVLPLRHRGLDASMGTRPFVDGACARAPRPDHRRDRRVTRRPVPEVDGGGRRDRLGVQRGRAGRRSHHRLPGPTRSRGVAGRPRDPCAHGAAHGRGRATRRRLLRAHAQRRRARYARSRTATRSSSAVSRPLLVADAMPSGATLVDLGPHRLRGVTERVPVFAVAAPGVDAPPSCSECPYQGLLSFDVGDSARFFGRSAVVQRPRRARAGSWLRRPRRKLRQRQVLDPPGRAPPRVR